METIWSAVAEGVPQVVFVGGEPGSGKSRLVFEAARVLHENGAVVLLGQCLSDYGTAYQPFGELVDALLPSVDQLVPEHRRAETRLRLEPLVQPSRLGELPTDPLDKQQRRMLFDAVVYLIERAAAERPLVLLLEDMHWAGVSSLELLAHVARRVTQTRLLVLATHRPTSPDRSEPLMAAIADLYRMDSVHRIDLGGLSTDDVTELLARKAGWAQHRARPFAAMLRDQTGGNPFFLWEMWRDIAARGGLTSAPRGELHVPATVRDGLAGRLGRLDAPDRQLIEFAAILGDQFDLSLLLATSPWGRETTLQAVGQAMEAGFMEPIGDGSSYRFPHSLARQSVMELIGPQRRARDHARIAQHLELRVSGATGEVERLAYHFSQAHGLGMEAKARQYLVEAARLAERGLAHAEAARYFEQAARVSEDAADRQSLLLCAADAHFSSADFARALALSESVVAEATDSTTTLEAAIRYEDVAPHAIGVGHRAVEILSDALGHRQKDLSDPLYVRGLASLGRALALSGAVDEADRLGSRAIALAREQGHDDLLVHALTASLWNRMHPSIAARQRRRAAEASELAAEIGDLRSLGPAALFRASYSYLVGDPDTMAEGQVDLRWVGERAGLPYFSFWAAQVEYGWQFLRGDFAGAEATAQEALDMGVRFGGDGTEGVYGLQTFMVRRETGRIEQVRALITGRERPQDHWAPGLLSLYTELGMLGPAARVLRWLQDRKISRYEPQAQWPAVLTFMVEAALALEDADALRRLRPMLAEHEGHNLAAGQFVAVFGCADRYLGSVDSVLGLGDPDASFAVAAEMDSRMGAVVHQTAAMAAEVVHLRRRGRGGDSRRATELGARARELAESIGQTRVVRMLPPRRGSGPSGDAPGLTARELDVLRLLADGRSNREIAKALVISENTAANHVRSILLKTGAANRTQAATYAISREWIGAQ